MAKDDKNDKELAASAKEHVVEVERKQFRPLLLSNPNYFGNLKDSAFKPVKNIVSNITYEELKCVGFNPQLSRLEAVVWIKQPSGYSGDICHAGSPEYVRFYLSFDNGATWLDQGMSSFTAYDIPTVQPLEYAVTLTINPFRQFCQNENLPLVRAILSWNQPPTDPNTPPVWGNVLETRIQIDPFWFKWPFSDFVQAVGLKLGSEVANLIDDTTQLQLKPPQALSPTGLKDLYAKHDVPAHRYLHAELQKMIALPEVTEAFSAKKGFLSELDLDLVKLIGNYLQINGNTDYEQLECVGFDPGSVTQDALVGTLRIKRPYGYLGNLCHTGSVEYVAFWVDWGAGWEWAGTASVRVHDITKIPKEGLCYAVYQPVNFEKHRRPCGEGAVTPRVRAILSWNSPPPAFDPNFSPGWGNRVETRIHLYPGAATPTGDYTPYLQNLCGIALCNIDQTTGFAPGERPFGASVAIHGHIPGAPNVNTPVVNRPRYKITVQPFPAGAPQSLNDSFPLTLDEQIGAALPTSTNITQMPDGANYYTYQEAPPVPGVGWRTVSPSRLLAYWNTSGKIGLWQISIEAKDPVTNTVYAAGSVVCVLDGSTRQSVVIDLDQTAPLTSLAITGVKPGGVGPCQPAVNCATFHVGDVICGKYSVSDDHFSSFSLTAEPTANPVAGFTVDGLATNGRSYPSIPTTGQTGTWTFNTAGLPPCGYTIQLSSSDRTIVSCGGGWQNNSAFVGFCLVP
jgi:hypothetical protein